MDFDEHKNYQAALKRAKDDTPSEYFHWLKEAIEMADAKLGDLPYEKRRQLAVAMAGHMAQLYSASKLDEALGIIHGACERIAERD